MAYGITQSLGVVRASSQRATTATAYGITEWNPFTMEVSFKLTSLPASGEVYGLMTIGWETRGAHLWLENNAGTYNLRGYRHAWGTDTTIISYSFTPVVGTWYHASFSKDGSNNGELCLNGVSVATGALGSGAGSSRTVSSSIGCGYNNGTMTHHLNGTVSLARVWDVKRTASEILANICVVFGTATTNMRAEYSLDNVYTDASGNAYTLTPSGSPTFGTSVPTYCLSQFFSPSGGVAYSGGVTMY